MKLVLEECVAPLDALAIHPEAVFTQAYFYAKWQESLGRKTRQFVVKKEGESGESTAVAFLSCILCPLPFSKTYAYIPYGPVILSREYALSVTQCLSENLPAFLASEQTVFVRCDFTPALSLEDVKQASKINKISLAPRFTYASAAFQPRSEWTLDLSWTEEALLKAMHSKTRYSINLAIRKGLTSEIVEKNLTNYLGDFCRLMKETAKRDDFHLHPEAYYRAIFADCEAQGRGFLCVTRFGADILSINLVIRYGGTALFLFGGSSDAHRNLVPSYLTQWTSVRHAKALGLKTYNFGGITSSQYPRKGWDGLTAFKKKFGGREETHSPFLDLVILPRWYFGYCVRKWLQRWFRI